MKPAAVAACVFLTVMTLSAIAFFGRGSATLPVKVAKPVPDTEKGPKVATEGPQPKAVIPETVYDFGKMAIGDEGSHVFIIKNEGEAPLEILARKDETTCSCTVGNVAGDGKLAPGEQTEVTLNWTVKLKNPSFRHYALIRTNDPGNRKIELTVVGNVEEGMQLRPDGEWAMGQLKVGAPSEATGSLHSPTFDKFEITEVKTDLPTTKVTWVPLNEDQLAERGAKSGYLLKATVSGDVPVGSYADRVTLKTNLEKHKELSFAIKATRPGPMDVMGRGWANEATALLLGDFPAKDGKTAELSLFVRELEGDLELKSFETAHNAVEVSLRKDENYKGKGVQRYFLTIKVLPGLPVDRQFKNSEKVILKLNHPLIPEYKFFVSYLSL